MTKVVHPLLAAMTLAGSLAAGAAHANLLTNPSFEAVDASAPPYYIRSSTNTPGWTHVLDGVDLIHNDYTQPPPVLVDASDGVQFLDMNQAMPAGLGGLYQEVAATPGMSYDLALDTAAWATNAVGGKIAYWLYDPASNTVLASGEYQDSVGGTWVTRTLSAVALSNSIGVRIEGLIATQAGMGLDNVVLVAQVPEPATTVLFGSGLALLLGFAARRRG